MKKILFFVVFFVCSLVEASAQNFSHVSEVRKVGKKFVATSILDSVEVEVSASQYLAMKKATDDYYIAEYKDGNGNFKVVVNRAEFTNWQYTVDSVGVANNGEIEVFFKGKPEPFKTKKSEWAKVIKGQRVRYVSIKSPERIFERYATIGDNEKIGVVNKMERWQKETPVVTIKNKSVSDKTENKKGLLIKLVDGSM